MYSDPAATLLILPGLPQTTTVAGYTTTVAMLTSQTVRADSYINGQCGKRYTLPLNGADTFTAAVPPLIRTLSQDLTAAWTYRAYFPKDSVAVNEWPERFEKNAMSTLALIRTEDIDLSDTAGSDLTERYEAEKIGSSTKPSGASVHFSPDFGHGDALTWAVDANKLEDESDNRP